VRRVRRLLILVISLNLFAWAICEAVYCIRTPFPVRAFQRHRAAFETLVAGVKDGSWPTKDDGQGFEISTGLWNQDVRYCRSEGDQIWFYFATGPIWPTDIIVYSPRGRQGMPRLDFPTLTDSCYLDNNWLYLRSSN
jgi:hypothetical protein